MAEKEDPKYCIIHPDVLAQWRDTDNDYYCDSCKAQYFDAPDVDAEVRRSVRRFPQEVETVSNPNEAS